MKYNKRDFTCARINGILNLDQSVVNQDANRKPEALTVSLCHWTPLISSYSQHISLSRGGKRGQVQRQAGTQARLAACLAHTKPAA